MLENRSIHKCCILQKTYTMRWPDGKMSFTSQRNNQKNRSTHCHLSECIHYSTNRFERIWRSNKRNASFESSETCKWLKFLPLLKPKAWMQEKVLQKMKKVSTMQSTVSNWLKESSRILGLSSTTKDIELAINPVKKELWNAIWRIKLSWTYL